VGANSDGGDSGGPHFTTNDGYAYYSGIHIGGGSGYSYAGYWEDHYDDLGLDFG